MAYVTGSLRGKSYSICVHHSSVTGTSCYPTVSQLGNPSEWPNDLLQNVDSHPRGPDSTGMMRGLGVTNPESWQHVSKRSFQSLRQDSTETRESKYRRDPFGYGLQKPTWAGLPGRGNVSQDHGVLLNSFRHLLVLFLPPSFLLLSITNAIFSLCLQVCMWWAEDRLSTALESPLSLDTADRLALF